MRSLTQLKESENKNPRSPIVKSEIKTPLSVKNKEVSTDLGEIKHTSLLEKNEVLNKLARDKQAEIAKLDKDITKRLEDVEELADGIVKKAKQRADEMMDNAKNKRTMVDGMYEQAKVLQFNAEAKNRELDDLIDKMEVRLGVIESNEESIKRNKKEVLNQLGKAKEDSSKANEYLNKLTLLFLSALKYVESIQGISDEFIDVISQNIEKADRMYLQVTQVAEENKTKENLNIERSKELDIKQNWLLDREKTISRSEREVKRSITNG